MIPGIILGLICLGLLVLGLRTPNHMAVYRVFLFLLSGMAGVALLSWIYLSVYIFPGFDAALQHGAGG